jgi:hypothetical protein
MTVNVDKGTWFCHACNFGGSVIDLLARLDNRQPGDVLKDLGEDGKPFRSNGHDNGKVSMPSIMKPKNPAPSLPPGVKPKVVKVYDYCGPTGELIYQSCRLEPKSFRQRRPDPDNPGKWAWNMEGVTRVLYNLPKLMGKGATSVWVVEGEKDADSLSAIGLLATTNVGGAGKWSAAYAEVFVGKEVVLCGDNDEPGRKHMADVLASLAGKASLVRYVTVPAPHKDISDLLVSFKDKAEAVAQVQKLYDDAPVFEKGIDIPVQSIAELEQDFRASLARSKENSLDLGKWLPELGKHVRPLMPGELVVIAADTAVGKTAILQNIALRAAPLKTLLFELELPGTLTFERFVAMATGATTKEVFHEYISGRGVGWRASGLLDHVYVCARSKLSPAQIEEMVVKSELKVGAKPALVMVDYMQLVRGGRGSRYERLSESAEELKSIAKAANVVLVVASQVSRKKDEDGDDNRREVHLHDSKDSGSIENSAGLLLGAWRDDKDRSIMRIRVLKNTKGFPGHLVDCVFDGARMLITEKPKIEQEDAPEPEF